MQSDASAHPVDSQSLPAAAARRTVRACASVSLIFCGLAGLHRPALAMERLMERLMEREQVQLAPAARPTASTGGDTAVLHRQLRKSIETFQDRWRKAWQKVEVKRHGHTNLSRIRGWTVNARGVIEDPIVDGDREAMNLTPDLRRYLAILCNVDSPSDRQIEYIKSKAGSLIGSIRTTTTSPGVSNGGRLGELSSMRYEREMSFVTPRLIAPLPNRGAICPSWTPPDEPIPLDEGEAIDLALPPNEREPLRREREQLLRTLAEAQSRNPDDMWIFAQRVRFTIDQRSPANARELLRECPGTSIECARIGGLVEEFAGDVGKAEAYFREAEVGRSATRAAGDSGARSCVDPEVWLLFMVGDREKLSDAACDEQRRFVDRMWWLADPLWSVPGNERYVAHNARQVMMDMRSVLDRDERYVWSQVGGGNAMRELVVRYGWPGYTYWPGGAFEEEISRIREDPQRLRFVAPPYTAKEYSPDRSALIPHIDGINNPLTITSQHWTLHLPEGKDQDDWWPTEHMMLFPILKLLPEGQWAQWRRDSTIEFAMTVDNAVRNGVDTAAHGPTRAALVASSGTQEFRVLDDRELPVRSTLRLSARYPSQPFVMSAEVRARTVREPMLRSRFGLAPPPALREMRDGELAMSDLAFMFVADRGRPLPTELDAVRAAMAGSTTFSRSDPVAIYWESYGYRPTDSVTFSLRINRREDIGIARRLGSALGVASALDDSVSISWTESGGSVNGTVIAGVRPIIGRSVAVDLNRLPPGNYSLSIVMQRSGAPPSRSERVFSLRP
ncbi:MAG: hypothetical protein ACO1Q7_17975 [Gemmatimonas sp.]